MCCHSIALRDLRVPNARAVTAVNGDDCVPHWPDVRPAGDAAPWFQPALPPVFPFRAGQSAALLTISQKDFCHAR